MTKDSPGGSDDTDRAYAAFAARLTATGILSDPWMKGRPRFREQPIVLDPEEQAALYQAAEMVTAVYDQVCVICDAEPALADSFFGLTPHQKLMWSSSPGLWHGIARADVFMTPEGIAVCELNCDTPSGEAEAVLLNELCAAQYPQCVDPNRGLRDRFCRMVSALARATLASRNRKGPEGPLSVGIVYPTEMTEDLSMILLYRQWIERMGWRVTLGSPYNLRRQGRTRAGLFDTPCDVFLRHYKTDWWGERLPVWEDEAPFADPEPLADQLALVLGSTMAGGCAVVNPFGSVLPQNKRAMAFMWEEMSRFPGWAQEVIRRFIPRSARLETLAAADLSADKDGWVLKSDYGCEGDEVVIGATTRQDLWDESLRKALPGRWIAQRYFQALALPGFEPGETINFGVYVVGGEACGLYSRISRGGTGYNAVSAPTLVGEPIPPLMSEDHG